MLIQNGKIIFDNGFEINYRFDDPNAMVETVAAVENHIRNSTDSTNRVTVQDMLNEYSDTLYEGLSKGDKLRIGIGVSNMVERDLFPELERNKPKGVTNTYSVK